MLFEFDADQRTLRRTARDILAKECTPALVRGLADSGHADSGKDPAPLWRLYVDLGWTQLVDPADAVELGILLDELGRATDPTPFLATMTQFAPLAPDVADERQTGTAVWDGITATPDGAGWRLSGTARHVLDGDRVDWFAVVTDAGCFVVPAAQASTFRVPAFDPILHIAEVTFDDVAVGAADRAGGDLARARQTALTGMALTMVGACRRVLELTLDHVRTRQQFGVPIGSFQAVQHKAVDMHLAVERASALAYYGALTLAADDPGRGQAAAMAKAAAGECQSVVVRNGMQLFGAMSFTWENDLQFALKRALAGELLLGTAAEHRLRITREHHAAQL